MARFVLEFYCYGASSLISYELFLVKALFSWKFSNLTIQGNIFHGFIIGGNFLKISWKFKYYQVEIYQCKNCTFSDSDMIKLWNYVNFFWFYSNEVPSLISFKIFLLKLHSAENSKNFTMQANIFFAYFEIGVKICLSISKADNYKTFFKYVPIYFKFKIWLLGVL